MLNVSDDFRQSGQYDKILKENLDVTLPTILRDVLHLNILREEELPDDIQHTKERKPDLLKKVTDAHGQTYVLHLEFQTYDDKDMVTGWRIITSCFCESIGFQSDSTLCS